MELALPLPPLSGIHLYCGLYLNESWFEPCGGFFFARNTLATGDFFRRVDDALAADTGMEDQQTMTEVVRNTSFARLALDPSPVNLDVYRNRHEQRTKPFVYTFFRQDEVWGNFNAKTQVDMFTTLEMRV